MACVLDGPVNGSLVNPFFEGQPTGFFRLALPRGFRELLQTLFQQQSIFFGKLLDSLEDFLDGFTHGSTSKGREPNWVFGSQQFP
jgi:hypothetical protein